MKQIETIKSGKNFSAVSVGKMTTVGDSLVGMIIPPDMPVSAGPGSNTDLPKQKDDWWNAWKNAFGMKLKKSTFHR